jgi:hypothetical protein
MDSQEDIVQLETPLFRLAPGGDKILLGNFEALEISTAIQRNLVKGDDGKPIKDKVALMMVSALNASPYLRQAIIALTFGSATRIMPGAITTDQQALDTMGWPQ